MQPDRTYEKDAEETETQIRKDEDNGIEIGHDGGI